jgi:hypothetical protein
MLTEKLVLILAVFGGITNVAEKGVVTPIKVF